MFECARTANMFVVYEQYYRQKKRRWRWSLKNLTKCGIGFCCKKSQKKINKKDHIRLLKFLLYHYCSFVNEPLFTQVFAESTVNAEIKAFNRRLQL